MTMPTSFPRYRTAVSATAFACALLAGCATVPPLTLPTALPPPAKPANSTSHEVNSAVSRGLTQAPTPSVSEHGPEISGAKVRDDIPALSGGPASINLQSVPVPAFINAVFGNMLALNVSMSPQVTRLQQLVTLRTEAKQSPADLYRLARQVLSEYGVSTTVAGKLVKFDVAATGSSTEPPLIISGRASPEVPISHRTVFRLLNLNVVSSSDASRWLGTVFGSEIKVAEETNRNAVLIRGNPVQVQQAVDALRVFDQPLMRGRFSTRLEPAFMSADQLTDRLIEVMNAQGYSTNRSTGSPSSVIVLPIVAVNSVLVFANNQETLNYAVAWAKELDKPSPQSSTNSLFYYQVKNTQASDIATVLSGIGSEHGSNTKDTSKAGSAAGNSNDANVSSSAMFLIDKPRNALIYRGDPSQWERTLNLIKQMDKAPRQVMIEVTIAEVTLDKDDELGVNWFAKNGIGRFDGQLSIGQGAGGTTAAAASGGGLSYLLNVAGQNRAILTALATDSRVSILSSPHLLVKSGSTASIDVGTEVPTVTMSTTSNQQTAGSTNLLQAIQYRKTGVILTIKPTVYSNDRVDLDVEQEDSEALPLAAGATANSPSILNRSLSTSISLRDGGSVVMAGLISSQSTHSNNGVPLLKDIPVLGNLFKSTSVKKNRSELVLMIVPYIIESDDQSASISQSIIDNMHDLKGEIRATRTSVTPTPAPAPAHPAPVPATAIPLPTTPEPGRG